MKLSSVIDFFRPRKIKVTTDQVAELVRDMGLECGSEYIPPSFRCPRWLIIRSPKMDPSHYFGELQVESSSILEWATGHVHVYSSNRTEQGARQHLPTWLKQADQTVEIPLVPDEWMLKVLQPYDENFIQSASVRIHCGECGEVKMGVTTRSDYIWVQNARKWESKWECSSGHVLKYELSDPIRFF